MKRQFSIIIFIFGLTSCNKLTEKHYKTTDITTGGFTDIRLDLNADNTITLLKIDQKVISQNDSSTVYAPDTLMVGGTWTLTKDRIRCYIKESDDFIIDAFFKSSLKNKDITLTHDHFYFPVTTDTIYIYGQPCIVTKTTNR